MDGKAIFDFSINEVPKQIKLFFKKKKNKRRENKLFYISPSKQILSGYYRREAKYSKQ